MPSIGSAQMGTEDIRDLQDHVRSVANPPPELWQAKPSPNSTSYCFDSVPHFQYFREFAKRPEGQGDITETMSLQGSCWMLTRNKYWELNVCDEAFGSWGSQGIEVAVKSWLSGGRVMVNKKTWYAHMFRTQGGDFGFPYPISGKDQEKAKAYARDLFFNNRWPLQKRPLSWLVEKFWPVPGWTEGDLKRLKNNTFRFSDKNATEKPVEAEPPTSFFEKSLPGIIYSAGKLNKGIIYYTDNHLKLKIAAKVQSRLKKISDDRDIPITASSIKNVVLGKNNVSLPNLELGKETTKRLILNGLENCDTDIVFLCANSVLYHPTHFNFTPTEKNVLYCNQNWWQVRITDGLAVHWDANQEWSLCGYRETLIRHYKGDKIKIMPWKSDYPNVNVINENDYKKLKWNINDFRNKSTAKNFTISQEIPGWGKDTDLVKQFQ
jgi:hypothetical protein